MVSTCLLCWPVKWVLPFVGSHLSIGIHPFRKWLVLLISFPRNPRRIGHMSWAEKCLTPCGPMYTTISRFVDLLGICEDYLVFDSPSFIAIFQCIFITTWYPVWCEMLVSDYVMICNNYEYILHMPGLVLSYDFSKLSAFDRGPCESRRLPMDKMQNRGSWVINNTANSILFARIVHFKCLHAYGIHQLTAYSILMISGGRA